MSAHINDEGIESLANQETDTLRSYTRLKLAIAAQLRGLMETLKKRASGSRSGRCEDLMAKLADDRFTLAVLGQFKRGKSSLMNAIIGRELLPVGVLPLTSAITVLKFGPDERLVIRHENYNFPEIEPVSALADFVTERGNPGNHKRVKTATVEVPLPFLRRGLEFVDTPGVGSVIEANTATTYEFLPECDAALFVTSADMPFSSVELEFLRTIREYSRKIFFVINKTDLLSGEDERSEVLDFVARKICEQTGAEHVRVFPVSARLALDAKIHHNTEAYEWSGLNALEEALAIFLSGEKAAVFLIAIIDRAERLLDEESGEVDLFKKARELSESERQHRLDKIRGRFKQCASERGELFARLRDHLVQRANETLAPQLDSFLAAKRATMSRYVQRLLVRSRPLFGFEVSERCGKWLLKRTGKQTGRWLHEHARRLDFDSEKAALDFWLIILSGVSELTGIAAKSFGLPLRVDDTLAMPWRFDVKSQALIMNKSAWKPRIPSWVLYLPVSVGRSALARTLETECTRLVATANENARVLLTQSVAEALGLLANEINARAEEIEARVVAAINGTRPPRRLPSQGMEPPEQLGWGEATLDSIRDKLLALRDEAARIATSCEASAKAPDPSISTITGIIAPSEAKLPRLRKTEVSIAARLHTRGCPVCGYLDDVAFNFFAKIQYDLYADENAQADFATTRGFCPLHMWQLHAISSPTGESVGLALLAEQTSRSLARSSRAAEPRAAISALLPDSKDCRVCILLHDAERAFIEHFVSFLASAANCDTYARSQGVCLRHLIALAEAVPGVETTRFLLAEAARHFDETAEDMQSYAMKRASTRGPAPNADEDDASLRALIHLAGERNLCAPWPTDGKL